MPHNDVRRTMGVILEWVLKCVSMTVEHMGATASFFMGSDGRGFEPDQHVLSHPTDIIRSGHVDDVPVVPGVAFVFRFHAE